MQSYGSWYRPDSNTSYLYIKNTGPQPLTFKSISVQGHDEKADLWPLDPDRRTNWFDFIPEKVAPGEICQVRFNLRVPAAAPISVSVTAESGEILDSTVTPGKSSLQFGDITFSKDGGQVSLFVRGTGQPISRMFMDGVDQTQTPTWLARLFIKGPPLSRSVRRNRFSREAIISLKFKPGTINARSIWRGRSPMAS